MWTLPPEFLDYAYRDPCLLRRAIATGPDIPDELLTFEANVHSPEDDAELLAAWACLEAEWAGIDVDPCDAVQKDRASADTCSCPGCGERRRIFCAAAGPAWRRTLLWIQIGGWRFRKALRRWRALRA
jgi:hypothetical protein